MPPRAPRPLTAIASAAEPLRAAAIDRAAQAAQDIIDGLARQLAAHGGDMDKVAPRPDARVMGLVEYRLAMAKLTQLRLLTVTTRPRLRRSEPLMGAMDPQACAAYVDRARQDASDSYSGFVAKMEDKVGAHSAATLSGDHVWARSVLTVTTPAGVQWWATQRILNTSKLGLLFHQWPSRRLRRPPPGTLQK